MQRANQIRSADLQVGLMGSPYVSADLQVGSTRDRRGIDQRGASRRYHQLTRRSGSEAMNSRTLAMSALPAMKVKACASMARARCVSEAVKAS